MVLIMTNYFLCKLCIHTHTYTHTHTSRHISRETWEGLRASRYQVEELKATTSSECKKILQVIKQDWSHSLISLFPYVTRD